MSGEVNQPDKMSLQELEALNDKLQQNIKKLNSEYEKNEKTLSGLIRRLKDVTSEFESMHKETTEGSLIGSKLGAAGGVTALVGLGLSFFTFGASLALTAVGVAAGITGGVTGVKNNITNMVEQKKLRKIIEEVIDDFQNTINPMVELLSTISTTIEELQQMEQMVSFTKKAILTGVRSVKTFSSFTKLLTVLRTAKIGETAAKAAKTLSMVGRISGIISALFLVLDAYSIYCDSTEISEMNRLDHNSKAEEVKSKTLKFILELKKTAAEFQETLDEIKSARDKMNSGVQGGLSGQSD